MKKTLLLAVSFIFFAGSAFSQTGKMWSSVKSNNFQVLTSVERESFPVQFELMQLNLESIKNTLLNSPQRTTLTKSGTVISIPNANGEIERFEMYEASNFESSLQELFPEIRSYVGVGLDDKYATLRLSIDAKQIHAMIKRADAPSEYIEPYSSDKKVYAIFKSDRVKGKLPFTCSTPETNLSEEVLNKAFTTMRSSDGELLDFRLAMSVTPEYTTILHGVLGLATPKTSALSAINTTLTRVNGVFETDFAVHLTLVNNMTIIYDGSVADPYGPDDSNYNSELQATLTSVVGNANYDVGHLMAGVGNNGNAGCIGCVCNSGKGSGYTTSTVPYGDAFDIDYVAHEVGHQFGANHTFSMSNEGTGVNMEVGSGVTVMGYAGITAQDTHQHSIDVFHAASIAQVQANMATKSCPSVMTIHAAPTVNAGSNYTIPQLTPFVLEGSGSGSGSLTYVWEQYDNASALQTGASSAASATKSSGPNWTNYQDSSEPIRYFPVMSSVMNNSTTTAGIDVTAEALSSVNRTLNFRLTARDNVVGQGQTNFDNMIVTVDASRGPLNVTSQNTDGIVWVPGSTETVTWTVNNTNAISGGANVDILYTADGGSTWNVILANTLNDGSQDIIVPSVSEPNCRVMVKASGNIFFNVNTKNIAIGDYVYESQNVCQDYTFNLNSAITESTTSYSGFSLPISDSFTITDVNVVVDVTHPDIGTTQFAISSPYGYTVNSTLSRVYRASTGCPGGVNLNKFFDMSGTVLNCSNTTDGIATIPEDDISTSDYIGTDSAGNWYIWFVDLNTTDGLTGTINYVTFNLCYSDQVPVLATESFENNDFSIYPNPNNGTFSVNFTSKSDDALISVYDMRGRLILNKSLSGNGVVNETINLQNAQSGIYLVNIQDGSRKVTKKIIVE